MSVRDRAPTSSADSVGLSATLELLASLSRYAEAGAVQPHTCAQAVQHALEQHGEHVDVLVAVSRLLLATEQSEAAARVLRRAARISPDDPRVGQLMSEAGLEPPRHGPRSARHPGAEGGHKTSVRRRLDPSEDEGPESARAPDSLGSLVDSTEPRSHVVPVAAKDATVGTASTMPPGAPRSIEGPLLRPTVKMTRVTPPMERPRWGKRESREPLDARSSREARPAFASRPDQDAPLSEGPRSTRFSEGPRSTRFSEGPRSARFSEGPRSARFPEGPRSVTFRDASLTPSSTPSGENDTGPRSRRAATGNLKFLDPHDERRRLDRYELIGEIASGGMASVFLARLPGVAGFQRFFAIKRLHPHLADEQEFIDMFLDEARIAAGIHHPNVVPILEIGTSEAGYYLVMDYIEGDTLSGVIARASAAGTLPRPVALRILLDALHGLHAAHELTDANGSPVDLVHRDCSPQNILVGLDGSSRITDFGVARSKSRLATTRSLRVKGKLAYLSPEQATGRPIDRRSDLFGMGAILWESLAGRRLFRSDSEGETLSRILVHPIPSLVDVAPDIPPELAEAVAIALARDPNDRYATAAEMANSIEHSVRQVETREFFVASPQDVGAFMRELVGADIEMRREAVRKWSLQPGDAEGGPRSQASRDDTAPSSWRKITTPPPANAPIEPDDDAEVDSEVPSTKKEASFERAPDALPPSSKKQPATLPQADRPTDPAPDPAAPAAEPGGASPPDQRITVAARRPPVALIAIILVLSLAVIALLTVRFLG
jgi:serine/threonine protein kinase